jgi:pimeloyl-ACP methyl ester carboxylesterase
MDGLLAGVRLERLPASEVALRARIGGRGPPLLLLHGNPQAHAMGLRAAPTLARRFTVITPELHGDRRPPVASGAAHDARRAMAADLRALMERLGVPRFAIAAQDRGARRASPGARLARRVGAARGDGHPPHPASLRDHRTPAFRRAAGTGSSSLGRTRGPKA